MALFRCSSGGGGSITLDKLLYDSSKTLLGSITAPGGSYTTTQDCVMFAKCVGRGSYSPWITLNGQKIASSYGSSGSKYQLYIGYASSDDANPSTYGIFVPSGTLVEARNDSGQTYDVRFYPL